VAVAAAATGGQPSGSETISTEDLRAYQEWKAMAQAAAVPPAQEDEQDEWDDYGYKLGAVALPLEEMTGELGFAAVAIRAETEKARAKKKPRSEATLGPRASMAMGPRVGVVSTAKLALQVDVAAMEALKARRDKTAARSGLPSCQITGAMWRPKGFTACQGDLGRTLWRQKGSSSPRVSQRGVHWPWEERQSCGQPRSDLWPE
jgi:hypothetical protein